LKTFAIRKRRDAELARAALIEKAKHDKKPKLGELKKFADSFKLTTPIPSDLVAMLEDPAKRNQSKEKHL
jgi:hypothetical protein